MPKMKATIFVEPGRIVLAEKPVPDIGPLDALIRITTTTICGTDVHILKGEYPVAKGLTVGHEPVGVIEKLGSAVSGCHEGQRVIAGAIPPSGHSNACLCGYGSQDGAGTKHGWKAIGGWNLESLRWRHCLPNEETTPGWLRAITPLTGLCRWRRSSRRCRPRSSLRPDGDRAKQACVGASLIRHRRCCREKQRKETLQMEPMKPMKPMEPMKPMSGGEKWWPDELGPPSSSGSQNSMRYAFFPKARRLLIEKQGKLTTYDSGDHQISGMQQSGETSSLTFTSQNGAVRLDELKKVG